MFKIQLYNILYKSISWIGTLLFIYICALWGFSLGVSLFAVTFCVSCDKKTAEIIKEKHLSPSQCFKRGVFAVLSEPMPSLSGQTIVKESLLSKKERQVQAMQQTILDLNDQIDKMKGGKANVNY